MDAPERIPKYDSSVAETTQRSGNGEMCKSKKVKEMEALMRILRSRDHQMLLR